ncbi:uncharacterized protein LOC115352937 isoform X3 [Aquila chrysaetos chrysaetos]|uniref:uncharacterized protein LOC115352937 isoform X3 n=1 Tax=Aquila chrysaetos chrysaetos TaxID=223781 RepID=UPI0011765C99|nr:uncharacterized protein LOC115352937 isoform X3 [Aquila chrysaetos chrysaetos]
MFMDIHTDTPNLCFSSHESLLTFSGNCESSLLLFPSLLVHIQMFDFQVPSLSLLVAIQAYFWNHYLQKINMKVFVSTAQAFLASTLKIMLLFQELHKDPSEKVRTAYRCTFQNSMKRGIKISPNTLSFKKLFPTELIGNLQRITLLVCPSQICRQTKEESFEQCAALLGEFSRAVDALDATGTGEFSVPYMLSTGEEALLLRTESLSSGQKVFQEQRGCVSPDDLWFQVLPQEKF